MEPLSTYIDMQLSFPFSTNIDVYDIRNFIVHDGNKGVFDFITSTFIVDSGIYFLTGAKKSGKTYICNIWHRLKGAVFIDAAIFNLNAEKYILELEKLFASGDKYILENFELLNINEEYLLQLINGVMDKKATLLISSTKYVREFDFSIEDLASRLKNIVNFSLNDLSDEYREQIILKLLNDRQMNIDSQTLSYIAKRVSGSYDVIFNLIDKIENKLNSKEIRKISINTIKDLI